MHTWYIGSSLLYWPVFVSRGEGDGGLWINSTIVLSWPTYRPNPTSPLGHSWPSQEVFMNRLSFSPKILETGNRFHWPAWCPWTIFCYREALVSPCDMVASFLPWNILLPITTTSFMNWSRPEPQPHFIECNCSPVHVPSPILFRLGLFPLSACP